jgi:flagellar hook-length control protein FliK
MSISGPLTLQNLGSSASDHAECTQKKTVASDPTSSQASFQGLFLALGSPAVPAHPSVPDKKTAAHEVKDESSTPSSRARERKRDGFVPSQAAPAALQPVEKASPAKAKEAEKSSQPEQGSLQTDSVGNRDAQPGQIEGPTSPPSPSSDSAATDTAAAIELQPVANLQTQGREGAADNQAHNSSKATAGSTVSSSNDLPNGKSLSTLAVSSDAPKVFMARKGPQAPINPTGSTRKDQLHSGTVSEPGFGSSPENNQKLSSSKPDAQSDGPIKVVSLDLSGTDQSVLSPLKSPAEKTVSQNPPVSMSLAAEQGGHGETTIGSGTTAGDALANMSASSLTAPTDRSASEAAISPQALTPRALSGLIGTTFTSAFGDSGNSFGSEGQFQDGLSSFMQNGAITVASTPASAAPSASGTLSLGNACWPSDLARWIGQLSSQRRSQITLELEPAHLGRISLKIEANREQVQATISTASEHVKNLLDQGSHALRQQLESQGLSLGQLTIDVKQDQGDQTFYHHSGGGKGGTKQTTRSVQATAGVPRATGVATAKGSTSQLINIFA